MPQTTRDIVRPGGKGIVDPREGQQILVGIACIVGPAAEDFVGAQVFQQGSAPGGELHLFEMERALHRGKLLSGPHFPVLCHPGGALGVPHLHGGQIIARQGRFQHQTLSILAFAAGRAAQHQCQHPAPP